ncbi:DUF4453 domain-containing protein [Maritimibacter sp. UBA3975]|uniref:DUF4453 domain-containing protein n=1 Tax=Maritimibacter sp. UBA3975 TaxID=1946833 RepID=UPI000C09FE86|nr:DUF4453 domain-containing protein [Maritimibacter sp. UBA3975]MAM63661.1 hypothetical protein [Maritimibacter sp.]|tara:strand:- start:2432 stop:3001 length:570 start_codon:yes stop_codon:yes gene_type:complete
MHRLIALTLLSFTATPAAAYDVCDEAWYIRNLIFDRAGYCFGSTLGQAVFDNTGCTGKDVSLSPGDAATVEMIREQEGWMACAVDTGATRLDVPHRALLDRLEVLPVPTDTASGCIGWTGGPIPLLAAPREDAALVGRGEAGVNVVWEYDYESVLDGWQFLTLYRDSELVGMGWSITPIFEDQCTSQAG